MRNLPKTDLHSHSILSSSFDVVDRITKGSIPRPPVQFRDLHHFLEYLRVHLLPWYGNEVFAIEIMKGGVEQLLCDNIVYAELSFDIRIPYSLGLDWEKTAKIFLPIFDNISNVKISLELGIPRPLSEKQWKPWVDEAFATGMFDGIDIYDDEIIKPLNEYSCFIEELKKKGKRIKIHTGEVGDPRQIWDDIEHGKPDAIQHGIRAIEDKTLLKMLSDLKIPCHTCPASNQALNVWSRYPFHPLRVLYDAGVLITVNTDDYLIFGKSVTEQLQDLLNSGFTHKEVEEIRLNGLRCDPYRSKHNEKK